MPVGGNVRVGGQTLPDKPRCVIPQSPERCSFRHHNNGMNKDRLPNDAANWPRVSHWLPGLRFQHLDLDKRGAFSSTPLTHGAGKSISNDLANQQHDISFYSRARDALRPRLSDLAIRLESGLHSCAPDPSDSQASRRFCRQANHLRRSSQRVFAPTFVTHHANRRQCCVADKRKEKRICAELDGAYP